MEHAHLFEQRTFPSVRVTSLSNSDEANLWKSFRVPIIYNHLAAVNWIDFCPTQPHTYAVTSSTRVHIYDPFTSSETKTITRFNSVAYSGVFKKDGKLLAAGNELGLVQLFDLSTRNVLRVFKGHKGAVRVVRFLGEEGILCTASQDKTVGFWDLSTQQLVSSYNAHADYIRAGAVFNSNSSLFVSGSYDHQIKVWDVRSPVPATTLNHGAPVEAVLPHPSASLLYSAGGREVKVWDVLTGREVEVVSSHTKTVTSLALDGSSSYLLSGSLDQSVRVHRTSNYSVLHTYKYTAPILSLAISPDNARIVVGCSDGLLHIKQRVGETSDRPSELDKALLKAEGAYRYFTNTKNDTDKPEPEKKKKKKKKKEEQVDRSEVRVSRKVTAYDRLLADFQFAQALDSVLGNQATRTKEEILELRRRGVQEKMQKLKKSTDDLDVFLGDEDAQLVEEEEGGESTADPVEVISLLMELQRRHVLVKALSGRDPASLAFILRFLIKHLSCQSYTSFLLSVTSIVFDIYEPTIGQSPTSDKLFRILQKRVQREQQYLTALAKLQGSLELILG